jgi:hypothetical protein
VAQYGGVTNSKTANAESVEHKGLSTGLLKNASLRMHTSTVQNFTEAKMASQMLRAYNVLLPSINFRDWFHISV